MNVLLASKCQLFQLVVAMKTVFPYETTFFLAHKTKKFKLFGGTCYCMVKCKKREIRSK